MTFLQTEQGVWPAGRAFLTHPVNHREGNSVTGAGCHWGRLKAQWDSVTCDPELNQEHWGCPPPTPVSYSFLKRPPPHSLSPALLPADTEGLETVFSEEEKQHKWWREEGRGTSCSKARISACSSKSKDSSWLHSPMLTRCLKCEIIWGVRYLTFFKKTGRNQKNHHVKFPSSSE